MKWYRFFVEGYDNVIRPRRLSDDPHIGDIIEVDDGIWGVVSGFITNPDGSLVVRVEKRRLLR